MILRPCLTCGRLTPRSRCPAHSNGTSWNGARNRGTQARFRAALIARAGSRCEYVTATGRCNETTELHAHHDQPGNDDPATGRLLCRPHHRLVDPHAR